MPETSYLLQDRKSFALGTTWKSVARTNLDFNRQQCDSCVVERFHEGPRKNDSSCPAGPHHEGSRVATSRSQGRMKM
jgi:hypothetical protein